MVEGHRMPLRIGLIDIDAVAYSYVHPVGEGSFFIVWKVLRHTDKQVIKICL